MTPMTPELDEALRQWAAAHEGIVGGLIDDRAVYVAYRAAQEAEPMTALRHCPFCGSENVAAEFVRAQHQVYCFHCGARMRAMRFESEPEAVEAWNTRHDPLRAKLEALVKEWRRCAPETIGRCADDLERLLAEQEG